MTPDLEPCSSYKSSGWSWLGDIPSHWEVVPGFAVFREKKQKNSDLIETQVLSLSYGKIVVKLPEKLHGLVPESFETYQIVDPGDIIIRSTDLQNDWNSLRVGMVQNRGIITSAYLCFNVREHLIPEYAYLLLHTYDLKKLFYGMGSGLRQNLDFSDFKRMTVLVPPKDEQMLIVRYVTWMEHQVNRYIRAKRRQIELLNEQKQAIIHQAVTRGLDPKARLKPSGIEGMGDIPEHWEVMCNRYIFRETTRKYSGEETIQLSLSQRDGLIETDIMKERSLRTASYTNFKYVFKDDLVLNRFKAHLGVFFASTKHGIVTFHYGVFSPLRSIRTKYFELLFHIKPYRAIYAGASNGMTVGLQNLSNQNFYKIHSLVPPLIEQDEILEYCQSATEVLDSSITAIEREIKLIREYQTKLITELVSGKLDVRGVEIPSLAEAQAFERALVLESEDLGEEGEMEFTEDEDVADD